MAGESVPSQQETFEHHSNGMDLRSLVVSLPGDRSRAGRGFGAQLREQTAECRRLKIIPNAFGEKAVLKLMFAAMTRAAERWRAIKITGFERRQMAALRQELYQEYEIQTGLARPTSKGASHDQFSSRSPT